MAVINNGGCFTTRSAVPTPRPTLTLLALFSHAVCKPAQRVTVIGGLICLTLFGILFWDNLWHFYYAWTTDDNYSHGFLVPLLSLYFASQIVRRGLVEIRSGVMLGGILLGLALFVRLITIPLPIPFLGDLALLVGLAGMFTLILGTKALSRYWFVFFFLVFMVPLPIAMYSRIASPLQLLASRVASTVMNATGVPVLCEGNRMTLPGGVQMFVAEACSGMRQMTGFLALTIAVAYLTARPGWYRTIVVLAALPIALTANVARVVLTGYIMHFVDREYASGTYHTLEGILMMGFGLLLLNSVCSLLNQFCQNPADQEHDEAIRNPAETLPSAPRPLSGRALLSGPAGWTSGGITENLVPVRAPEGQS
jgi:exosortase